MSCRKSLLNELDIAELACSPAMSPGGFFDGDYLLWVSTRISLPWGLSGMYLYEP